ncbi:LOW QUALITY PROTEIN: hypothetical protein CVT26_014228 [Gymnopilus dilepis]|uniref:Uncharacterized protein n=1 Tax=Gymnopilus dilepis TaxID=231916 RepID=A0A409VXD1_9AGAR|nr:LOW QUALITY PROTEIN: hypothetical protein CVT26_014228 [Gymnopilus dilepis]
MLPALEKIRRETGPLSIRKKDLGKWQPLMKYLGAYSTQCHDGAFQDLVFGKNRTMIAMSLKEKILGRRCSTSNETRTLILGHKWNPNIMHDNTRPGPRADAGGTEAGRLPKIPPLALIVSSSGGVVRLAVTLQLALQDPKSFQRPFYVVANGSQTVGVERHGVRRTRVLGCPNPVAYVETACIFEITALASKTRVQS